MSKDLLAVNIGTVISTATVMANLETAITFVVLLTALTINVKKLIKEYRCKRDDDTSSR